MTARGYIFLCNSNCYEIVKGTRRHALYMVLCVFDMMYCTTISFKGMAFLIRDLLYHAPNIVRFGGKQGRRVNFAVVIFSIAY